MDAPATLADFVAAVQGRFANVETLAPAYDDTQVIGFGLVSEGQLVPARKAERLAYEGRKGKDAAEAVALAWEEIEPQLGGRENETLLWRQSPRIIRERDFASNDLSSKVWFRAYAVKHGEAA